MKINILTKIIFSLIFIGLLPIAAFTFLTIDSYQGLIEKYTPYIEAEHPELVSETKLSYENIKNQTYFIFLLIVVFIVFLSVVLSRKLTYPIKKLIRGTNKLRKGKLSARINIKTKDEFETLANSFNRMAADLQESYSLIEEEKQSLEIKVQARTKELTELAESLEDKVKERTKKLEEERNKTLAVITNFTDGLLVFGKEDKLLLVNPKLEEFFGVKGKDIEGKSVSELQKNDVLKSLIELFGGKGIKEIFREELKLKKGLVLEVSTIPIIRGKKERLGSLVILHDITREKLVERMKTEFVSLAAHQLRTPLSAIKWTLKMLLDGDLGKITKEQKEFLDGTYKSNERMIALINDLLNVTRIEEGRYLYKPILTDIEDLINSIVNSHKERAKERNLILEFRKPQKKLPKVMLDVEKMSIAIINLLNNAIRYTPSGSGGKVTISLRQAKKGIEFSIKDTGVGIPKAQQKRVFTKFFRGVNVIKMETEGTGLGLFIAKNIIEAHKGKIWFESKEGRGTTFYFTIPLKRKS